MSKPVFSVPLPGNRQFGLILPDNLTVKDCEWLGEYANWLKRIAAPVPAQPSFAPMPVDLGSWIKP